MCELQACPSATAKNHQESTSPPEHISREVNLAEDLLNIEHLKQPELARVSACARVGQLVRRVQLRVPHRPPDATRWEQIRHVHIRLERLADRQELRRDVSLPPVLPGQSTPTHSASPSFPIPARYRSARVVTAVAPSLPLSSRPAAHSHAAARVMSRTLPRLSRDTTSLPHAMLVIIPRARLPSAASHTHGGA
jgi:hypothetical protein